MTERPILFNAPMVRALLDGSKTQTRRLVKPQPTLDTNRWDVDAISTLWIGTGPSAATGGTRQTWGWSRCPYGKPGDRLWVREAIHLVPDQEPDDGTGRVLSAYSADGVLTVADAWPWKRNNLPSMHCPRGLSRIDLEVTGVRVERLQDISEADAKAEGSPACARRVVGLNGGCDSYLCGYRQLWKQINGAGTWDANPWVWVIDFRKIGSPDYRVEGGFR